MKPEAIQNFDQSVADAKGALYDAGFSDGVASVPPGEGQGISQADLDKAVSDAKAAMQIDLDAMKSAFDGDEQKLADHAILEAAMQAKLDKIAELLKS